MGKPGQPASARLAHALTGYIHISAVHAPPRKRIVGSFEKFEGLDVAALIERNWSALCALMDAGTTDEFAWRISDIYDQESGENCELHMTNWQAQLMTRDGYVRSEEHPSALQSLMRISYAVFCLTKK